MPLLIGGFGGPMLDMNDNVVSLWEAQLLREKNGKLVKGSLFNALLYLKNHPALTGKISYNEFSYRVLATKPLPWPSLGTNPRELEDHDASHLAAWLEEQGQRGISKNVAADAIGMIARENPFHPLRDYLWSLKWDGTPRIQRWLNYYCGAADNEYTRTIGRRFLIGAVARALQPGCKMDNMLILEGAQGIGKSSLFRSLFGAEFTTDSLSAFGTKDAAQEIQGRWCIEIAELAQFGKVDMRHIKEALSKDRDRFRAPFARLPQEFKRQCVFVGTCNPGSNGWQKDETGARRFWPVKTTSIDLMALQADRNQLWAEAVVLFRAGERWYLDAAEQTLAEVEQEDRYDEDVWMDQIENFCIGLKEITIAEILWKGLDIPHGRQSKAEQMRVATCLRKIGFEKVTKKISGRGYKIWVREVVTVVTEVDTEFTF